MTSAAEVASKGRCSCSGAQFVQQIRNPASGKRKIEKKEIFGRKKKKWSPFVRSSTPATNTPSSWFASKSNDVPGKTQNERKPLLLLLLRLQSAQTATAQQQQERTHNSPRTPLLSPPCPQQFRHVPPRCFAATSLGFAMPVTDWLDKNNISI